MTPNHDDYDMRWQNASLAQDSAPLADHAADRVASPRGSSGGSGPSGASGANGSSSFATPRQPT
eukprot:2470823-Pyramimonas_sp.AAC.1